MNAHWSQRMTNQELDNGTLSLTKTIRYQRPQYAGHTWRHNDEVAYDLLFRQLLNSKYKTRKPTKTYSDQLRDDTDPPVD